MTATESNRMLLELEKIRRDANRDIMNPHIPELSVEDIQPILELVARVRLAYLQELLAIVRTQPGLPSPEQVDALVQRRTTYEEMCAAVNALETAIERGYIDAVGH